MKRVGLFLVKAIGIVYVVICACLYFFQERLIFKPQKLAQSHTFNFTETFEEKFIKTEDGTTLHGVFFKAKNSKGLLFYLHGNFGSVANYGDAAKIYTDMGYDTFFLDYRGYGKSEGVIKNEAQLFEDNQYVFDQFKALYKEKEIVVLGYSIGTGMAAKLASENRVTRLILEAPYYSLEDLILKGRFAALPSFLLKYKFSTYTYLQNNTLPIGLLHGKNDGLIPTDHSIKLHETLNSTQLFLFDNLGHVGMSGHEKYESVLHEFLN